MRAMMFAMLLGTGCLGTSDEYHQQYDGESVEVTLTSSVQYDTLEVAYLPTATAYFDVKASAMGTYLGSPFSYMRHYDRIGDGPRSLAFTALVGTVVVAKGDVASITYTVYDEDESLGGSGHADVTLTPVQ